MTRAFVVGRRRTGRHVGRVVREVGRLLRAEGWHVDARVVRRKADLRRVAARAVKDGCRIVVAVGGDGGVGQVAAVVAGTRAALGIVPTGTGNLLASNLGIPHARSQAVRTIVHGRKRRIDLGSVELEGKRRGFAVACGVGFDADVIDRTSAGEKRRLGRLAYMANVLSQAGAIENAPHEVTLDGATITTEAAQVFVANFGGMLPAVRPRRAIRPDDGVFDVIIVRAAGPLDGLLAGWEALRQKDLGESRDGRVFRAHARTVRIDTDPSRLVEADGSIIGRTPLIATIRPRALAVIVPAR